MNRIDEIIKDSILREADYQYNNHCSILSTGDFNKYLLPEVKQALYTAIMEVMPKEYNIVYDTDIDGRYFEGGYNQAITDITTSLNELFGRE